MSFCNSIATIRGGTHVQYVTDQIVNHVLGVVNKRNKTAGVKPFQIKNHMWVFVNALIDNPTFDSQTKETLTTRSGSFGSKCELSAKFLEKGMTAGFTCVMLGTFVSASPLRRIIQRDVLNYGDQVCKMPPSLEGSASGRCGPVVISLICTILHVQNADNFTALPRSGWQHTWRSAP